MAGGRRMSAVALVALVVLAAAAAAPGVAGQVCGVDQSAMNACRSYCKVGSTLEKPKQACCDAVAGADFNCLCKYKGLLQSYSSIDSKRVMEIPTKCGMAPVSCK